MEIYDLLVYWDGYEFNADVYVKPKNNTWEVTILGVYDENIQMYHVPEGLQEAMKEAAVEWADENYDVDSYYDDRQYHGRNRI